MGQCSDSSFPLQFIKLNYVASVLFCFVLSFLSSFSFAGLPEAHCQARAELAQDEELLSRLGDLLGTQCL